MSSFVFLRPTCKLAWQLKKQQLLELRDEYGKLKQDHDRAKERLQEEMAAVKKLQAQLAALSKWIVRDSLLAEYKHCFKLTTTFKAALVLVCMQEFYLHPGNS